VNNRRRDGPGSLRPPIDLDDERTKQMSNYIQLGDVHTYYEEDGAGEPLVLLHPGLADSRAFEEYVPELAQHFHQRTAKTITSGGSESRPRQTAGGD
jgi:hypothetical protein